MQTKKQVKILLMIGLVVFSIAFPLVIFAMFPLTNAIPGLIGGTLSAIISILFGIRDPFWHTVLAIIIGYGACFMALLAGCIYCFRDVWSGSKTVHSALWALLPKPPSENGWGFVYLQTA